MFLHSLSYHFILFGVVIFFLTLSVTSQFTWNHSTKVVWANGCDFLNHDIGDAREEQTQCSAACERHVGCTHFTWTTYNGGTCWFKRKADVETSEAIQNSLQGTVCGILTANAWTKFVRESGNIMLSRWFSDEGNGYSGRMSGPIASVVCRGRYCDDKLLKTYQIGDSLALKSTGHWTHWFSDENRNWADCPTDMLVNEIQCSGRYCDNIRLQCGRLEEGYRVDASDLRQVEFFSEETGEGTCPDGYYLWGMACRESFCDELKLNCLRVDIHRDLIKKPTYPSDEVLARNFAPRMVFHSSADQFPLPVSKYWADTIEADGRRYYPRDKFSFNSPYKPEDMGLTYKVVRCSAQTKIWYWSSYKGQKKCTLWTGSHEGDWEHLIVELTSDFQWVHRVIFGQHGGWYARYPGSMEMVGTHVVSHVGRASNGQYHDAGGKLCNLSPFPPYLNPEPSCCLYFGDARSSADGGKIWDSWKTGTLLDMKDDQEWNKFGGLWGLGDSAPQGPNLQEGWVGRNICTRYHCKDGCSNSMGP